MWSTSKLFLFVNVASRIKLFPLDYIESNLTVTPSNAVWLRALMKRFSQF